MIPEWCEEYFANWTNLTPIVQSVEMLSVIQVTIMSLMSALAPTTDPWLWGCLGLPWTIFRSGHMLASSAITAAVNSEPLSDWRITGAPISSKISASWKATSVALLEVRHRRTQNLVKWSWYYIIHLKLLWDMDCISIKWIWPLEANSDVNIGLTTTLFVIGCFLFFWNSRHIDLNNSTSSLKILAYLTLDTFIIRSLPPWPVATWAFLMMSNVFSMLAW